MAKPTALQKEVIRLVKNELDYLATSNDIDSPSHHTSITHEMLHNFDDWYDDGADEKYYDEIVCGDSRTQVAKEMRLTKEDIEAMQKRVGEKRSSNKLLDIIDVPKAKGDANRVAQKKFGKMNKTEAEYARYLDLCPVTWMFEPIKFRLADSTSYCPDFMVMDRDGNLRFIDTKAWWASAKKVGVTEDAMVKMKVAAEMYPMFEFAMTWKQDGVWQERVF